MEGSVTGLARYPHYLEIPGLTRRPTPPQLLLQPSHSWALLARGRAGEKKRKGHATPLQWIAGRVETMRWDKAEQHKKKGKDSVHFQSDSSFRAGVR